MTWQENAIELLLQCRRGVKKKWKREHSNEVRKMITLSALKGLSALECINMQIGA